MLKELNMETALKLQACLHKYGHNFVLMRKAVKMLDIDRENTVIPRRFFKLCFAVRKAMVDPSDKGGKGKVHEAVVRLIDNPHVTRALWREFFAHGPNQQDVKARKTTPALEVKHGAGDWLKSSLFSELDDIKAEYRTNHTEYIQWDIDTSYKNSVNPDDPRNGTLIQFSIRCTWGELFDYLDSYSGRGQWWKLQTNEKRCGATGQTVWQMQEFRTSWPKCEHLLNCPYRQDR